MFDDSGSWSFSDNKGAVEMSGLSILVPTRCARLKGKL